MDFLYLLEGLRTPFWDGFFSLVTHLGSELVFMVLAVALYWCADKSRGMYLLCIGCLGTIANQFLKLLCRVPRPWVKDPGFTIVESARADAGGYSFPSGHTQNAVGTFGCLAVGAKRRWLRVVYILFALLTAFSRMYLGVHTPADVLVSLLIAVVMVVGLEPLFRDLEHKPVRGLCILGGLLLLSGLFVLYANFGAAEADDTKNLAEGVGNAAKLMGALLGMTAGYIIDIKWLKSRTEAPFLGQILKCVLGLALLLAIKEGLKPVLGSGNFSGGLRYGLMTLFASGIWPAAFPLFAKIGRKKA